MKSEREELLIKKEYTVKDLRKIMEILRSEDGCPWDREQDHKSIRNDLIEETYEAVEAIDCSSKEMLLEELGDILLQVVFHSRISEEAGEFTFDDVVTDICKKLIVRHPHVFGEVKVESSADVLVNWDAIKKETKGQETLKDTLRAVSPSLPSLMRAAKVSKKAFKGGHETADAEKIALYTKGEVSQSADRIASELYTLAAAAQRIGKEPEQLLYDHIEKVIGDIE